MTPPSRSSDPEAARHRALGDPTRVALLETLERAGEPLDAHVLARDAGLHVNTVRWHLRTLLDAGLVAEEPAPAGPRGRPRRLYRLAVTPVGVGLPRFGLLSEILVDTLARGPDATEALEEAGRIRGRALARPRFGDGRSLDSREALGQIVRLLETLGFEPRLETGERIAMRPCPFGELATRHSSIVCPVHLGLMRGTLEALDAPVEATALEPFAAPDRCIAHFRPRPARD